MLLFCLLIASPDWAINKKGMGVCTFAYPAFRLSHCPSVRISNAASPRQDEIYRTPCDA